MRKRPFALLLVTLGCASIAAVLSCSGPIGPTGDSVTGPPGSPGPTGPIGPTGLTGSIVGLPPNTLWKHVVIVTSSNAISVSWDMLQVGTDFYGPAATHDIGQFHTINASAWAPIVVLGISTASTEVGVTDSLVDVPGGARGERQIGWVRADSNGKLLSFRQVDRDVRYLGTADGPLLSGAGPAGAFAKISASTVQKTVPPGARHLTVRSHILIPNGSSNAQTDELALSEDGTASTSTILTSCFTGAYNTLSSKSVGDSVCAGEGTAVLDPAQELFYSFGSGASGVVDLNVTGYVDETL